MGLLPETVNGFLLRKAIRAVDRGEVWAGRLLVSRLLRRLQIRLATQDLSDREVEVLELIADGLSNQEIADKLFICRETVRWHIRSLYSKIGAKDRASAVRYAKEYLLVESESLDPIPPRITPRDSKIADEKMAAD
jgi:DNA-binding NarL/FixJ family response regulator